MIGTFLIIIGALLLAGYISKGVSELQTLLPLPQGTAGDSPRSHQGRFKVNIRKGLMWERPGRAAVPIPGRVQNTRMWHTRGSGVTLGCLDLLTLKVSCSLKDPVTMVSVGLQSHRE